MNELSSALRRRFNTVVLPLPATAEEEVRIVADRVEELGRSLALPEAEPALDEIRRVVTIFRELREGVTEDGRTKLKSPTATLSTAEAISVVLNGYALAAHFGDGTLRARDVAGGLTGRRGQGPGAGPPGLAGVPGDRRPRARRLAGPLPGVRERGLRRGCSSRSLYGPMALAVPRCAQLRPSSVHDAPQHKLPCCPLSLAGAVASLLRQALRSFVAPRRARSR